MQCNLLTRSVEQGGARSISRFARSSGRAVERSRQAKVRLDPVWARGPNRLPSASHPPPARHLPGTDSRQRVERQSGRSGSELASTLSRFVSSLSHTQRDPMGSGRQDPGYID